MLSRENGPVTPRRRVLLLALAVVVLVGGAVLFTARGTDVRLTRSAPQDQPGPVVLVPGYGGGTTSLEALGAALQARGREAFVVRLPGNGTGDLRAAARALDDVVTQALSGGAPSVDVIGYSAGGITARYWVKELGGAAKARRIITLGSPHHGTDLARLGLRYGPVACPLACEQLVPGSDLLDELNDGDETPDGPQWVSLWTAQDQTVTPPETSRLEGAVDVRLQDICPGAVIDHGQLPTASVTRGLLLRALDVAPVAPPRADECAALEAAGRELLEP